MSVNQIKKATAALKSYLHKDEKAQQLLDDLVREVTELRAVAAASTERLETVERISRQACNARDTALVTVSELQHENKRLKINAANDEREISQLNDDLGRELDDKFIPMSAGDLVKDLTTQRLYRWSRKTLREVGTLPKPRSSISKTTGWALIDVLPGLDESGFATLGRIVTLHTLIRGSAWVCMFDEMSSEELGRAWTNSDRKGFDRAYGQYLGIFKNEYDLRSSREALADKTSGQCGWGCKGSGDTTADIFGRPGEDEIDEAKRLQMDRRR